MFAGNERSLISMVCWCQSYTNEVEAHAATRADLQKEKDYVVLVRTLHVAVNLCSSCAELAAPCRTCAQRTHCSVSVGRCHCPCA